MAIAAFGWWVMLPDRSPSLTPSDTPAPAIAAYQEKTQKCCESSSTSYTRPARKNARSFESVRFVWFIRMRLPRRDVFSRHLPPNVLSIAQMIGKSRRKSPFRICHPTGARPVGAGYARDGLIGNQVPPIRNQVPPICRPTGPPVSSGIPLVPLHPLLS